MTTLDGVKAILFDFGGTLYHVSFDEVELVQRILEQLGKGTFSRTPVEQALGAAEDGLAKTLAVRHPNRIGYVATPEDWMVFNQYLLSSLGIVDREEAIAKAMHEHWDNFWHDLQESEAAFTIRSEWRETFDKLAQKGYKLGVISNTTVDLRPWLKIDKVWEYLSVVLQSYEFGRAKPNKSIFHQACAKLGFKPQQVAYVGNHYRIDIIGAHHAGLVPIFITDGKNQDEIPNNTPFEFHIIDSLTEIINLLPLSSS
ncbi:MAG: HAD family hydrolase [Candidatus Heimdallarchaeota archaeon]